MTDHTTAAQAAHTNPLSDEYVNAVTQQHGYQSPETVIARLNQWIGLHGGENGVTLLMYEAHKALSKLRAPVADEDDQPTAPDDDAIAECWVNASDCDGIAYDGLSFERGYRAALASAPVAGEAVAYRVGTDLFLLEALPAAERYAEIRQKPLEPLYAAPQASEAVRDARALIEKLEAWQAVCDRIVDQYGGVVAGVDFAALGRANRAALASAPVAGEARIPPGYRVKVVEGHGYRITAPSGADWVAHSDTPAGDLIAALLAAPQASEAD